MDAKSFEETRRKIEDGITEITKCYILINFAYNTEEEKYLYKKEFKKRYINFYKTILNARQEVEDSYKESIRERIKGIFDLEGYKNKMSFLEGMDLSKEESNDINIDADYERKTSNSNVKLNFYHNNGVIFGPSTRFHVNTTKYGAIDPVAHTQDEEKYIFDILTYYFEKNFRQKEEKSLKYENV